MDEEAYVLRLPLPLAARVRELMELPGATRDMGMHVEFVDQPGFEQGRLARVRIGEDFFPATLMDLPTVIESAKSVDGVSYYKSGHVSQVLVVSEMMMTPAPPSSYVERDGLTPPARGIRDFWAANQPINPRSDEEAVEIERVEAKLKRIIDGQMDVDEDEGRAPVAPGAGPAAGLGGGRGGEAAGAGGPSLAEGPRRSTLTAAAAAAAAQPSGAAAPAPPQHTFQDLFGDSDEDSDESDPAESGLDA